MATMSKSMSDPMNGGRGIADKAQQTASEVVNVARDKVTSKVTSTLTDQKTRAATSLGGIAGALRDGGIANNELLSGYAERAADGIEAATTYFKDKDVREIVTDVERFARREPALFLGGAFTLGLLAARFLKSSSRRESNYESDYGRGELMNTRPPTGMGMQPSGVRMTPRPMAPPMTTANYGSTSGSMSSYGNNPTQNTTPNADPFPREASGVGSNTDTTLNTTTNKTGTGTGSGQGTV